MQWPEGLTVRTSSDAMGRPTTIAETDANGNVTTSCYDGFDRLAELRYPSTATPGASPSCASVPVGSMPAGSDYESWTYAATGELVSTRRRDGQSVGFTYDLLGRLTARTPPAGNDATTYVYDLLGRRTSASVTGAPARSLAWSYDKAGRVLSATQGPRTLTYGYDPGVTWMETVWPDGARVRTASDAMGRPTAISDVAGTTLTTLAAYQYDKLSRRTRIDYGNGTATIYTYDPDTFRLARLKNDLAGTASDVTFGLEWNAASELTKRDRDNDAYAWTNSVNEELSYSTNGLNQYTSAGVRLPAYDARGNMTANRLWAYAYDIDNRLTQVSGPASQPVLRCVGASREERLGGWRPQLSVRRRRPGRRI